MQGYLTNIDLATRSNTDFRRVVYTGPQSQLVLMSLQPGEDIGMEVHDVDQFFRCEGGEGVTIVDGVERFMASGTALVVPAGASHNIINRGQEALKLYTIYSPPNHRDGVVHPTKAAALADDEHFDGRTTEWPGGEETKRERSRAPSVFKS